MAPDTLEVWQFGSRSGSAAALLLFSAIFATLGSALGLGLRRGAGWSRRAAAIAAALFTLALLALFWRSALGGFYEAEFRGDRIALYYLAAPAARELPLASIQSVQALPAFKTRWRLHLTTANGGTYESATWNRPDVENAAAEIGRRVETGGH